MEKEESKNCFIEGQTAELDWFDFETRMRKLIHELLEPHINRGMEDRDFTMHLKKTIEI